MSWTTWLRRWRTFLSPKFTQSRRKIAPKRARLHLEGLEERTLFAANVAASAAGIVSDTAAGNSTHPSVSSNGLYTVFTNSAANLTASEVKTNSSVGEIFLLNRDTQQVTLISHASGAGNSTTTSNGNNFNPVISPDGNWIAWESTATNLAGSGFTVDPTNGPNPEVFLYNVSTGKTVLVSHAYNSATTAANDAVGGFNPFSPGGVNADYAPTIGGDAQHGIWVAYLSRATNIISNFVDGLNYYYPGSGGVARNAYLYNATTGTNILLSHDQQGAGSNVGADGDINTITMSADSTGIAYTGLSGNQVRGQASSTDEGGIAGFEEQVFLAKESSSVTNWSSWSTYLVSHSAAPGANPYGNNMYLIDSTTEINFGSGGGNFTIPYQYNDIPPPAINANGTFVAYVSAAVDLTSMYPRPGNNPINGYQTYLYTLGNGSQTYGNQATTLVSHMPYSSSNSAYMYYVDNSSSIFPTYYNNIYPTNTAPPAPAALTPAISADGRYVAFYSDATNLGVNNGVGYNTYLFDSQAPAATQVKALTHKAVNFNLFPSTFSQPQLAADQIVASPVTMSLNGQSLTIGTVGIASAEISGLTSNQTGPDALVYNYNTSTGTGAFSLVSHTNNGTATSTGNLFSQAPVVSADGTTLAFLTDANNLVASGKIDVSDATQVFVYFNHASGSNTATTQYDATMRDPNLPSLTANGYSFATTQGSVSDNGRYVVFTSDAENVVPGEVDTADLGSNVFLLDRQAGTTTLISGAAGSTTAVANGASGNAVISGDGNFVAFYSTATNLVGSGGAGLQVYVYDVQKGTLSLASHVPGKPAQASNDIGNAFSAQNVVNGELRQTPSISHDGSLIAYISGATDLVSSSLAGETDGNAFLYNRLTDTTVLVSHRTGLTTTAATKPNQLGGTTVTSLVSINNNGTKVAFTSFGFDLITGQSGVSGNSSTAPTPNLFVYDVAAGTVSLVSHKAGANTTAVGGGAVDGQLGSNADEYPASLSNDGKYIVYTSDANNLVTGQTDTNGTTDVFLYNTTTGTSVLVSHISTSATTAGSAKANSVGTTGSPVISGDGSTVAFESDATNLLSSAISIGGADAVFMYNVSTGVVSLVSHATNSATTATSGMHPTISKDGQTIGFIDFAPPLNASKWATYPTADMMEYTNSNNTVTLMSSATTGANNPSNGLNTYPSLSADGTTWVWNAIAQTEVAGELNGSQDVIVNGPPLGGNTGTPPVITSANHTTFIVGQSNTFTVTATGNPTPTLGESGSLPAGVSFNAATGVLSGNPTTPNTNGYTFTFTAVNGILPNASQQFTLYVDQAPTITSANSTTFIVGQNNTFTVTTTGAPTPTVSEAGPLPNGVTFNTTTNVLSGNPTVAGTYVITFTATNGVNPDAKQTFTLQVNQAPTITSANSTTFIVGQNNTFTVTATGTPVPSLSEAGPLPNGVTFNAATGVLSGNPTIAGTYPITFTATNGVNPDAKQTFTLQVNQAPTITSANSTTFIVGQNNTFTVTATGTPNPSLSEAGTLPNGVTFNAATGVLSGNPTVAGTYAITFTATNGVNPDATQPFTLQVNQAPTITSASSTTFIVGQNNTFTVTATGTPNPTLSEAGPLPNGVTFNAATGVLSGNPTIAGTFPITFTATNGVSPDAVQNFTLQVNQAPTITSANNTTFIVGQNNTFTVTATGTPNPTLSEAGPLPNGVTFNAATGVLSGNPTIAGTYAITFTATNGVNPDAVQNFTLQVNQAPTITSANSTTFIVGQNNTFTVTATGTPNPTLSEAGPLPNGVTFNAATGVLSGNPTIAGTYAITFTATNGVNPDAVQNFTLQVNQAPTITSANNTTFIVGQNNTFTVTATGTPNPTLSEAGPLPNGVTFNAATGVLSGNPTIAGTYAITFTATNGVNPDAVQNFTLQVNQAPTITSANNTTFIVGQNNTFTVTATGTPNPSLSELGTLPNGVTFNAATGVLSGNPTVAGTYAITFTATNGVNPDAVQNFTLQVNQAPTITSANNTTFIVGQNNTFTVTATGTPTPSLSELGTLPNGVTFNAATGVLSGNPTVAGTYAITFTATNGVNPDATQSFTLQVNQAPTITSANNTTFIVGQNNTFTVTATGTPNPTLSELGTLPNGVTFNAATGVLSGNPTAAGTYAITFTATNGVNPNATQSFTLQVNQAPTITSANNTTFIVGQNNTFTVTATGTPNPTLSELGTLPNGVTFNAATGVLSGNPTVAGTYAITFTATNGVSPDATQSFTLQVNQAPTITSANNTTFIVGQNNTFTVTATGTPNPTLSELGTLPNGVTFNAATGVLSGNPTAAGTYAITFTAANGVNPNATQSFTLQVNQAPTITSANNTTFIVGQNNTFTVTATGTPNPSLSELGTLPNGVTFNAATGVLSGNPTAAGTYALTFTATNGVSPDATQSFTLQVNQAPTITSANSTTFIVGQNNSFTVTATGTPNPSLSEVGKLPNGVTFTAATGVLSGNPTVAGTYALTFTAANGVNPNATQSFTLQVNQAPTITSANHTTFIVGQNNTFTVTATGTPAPTLSELGTLPNGVTFTAATGVLSGNPTVAGTYALTFTAANGVNPNATQSFTLQVNQAPTITSANSTTFFTNMKNSFTVTATGTPKPTFKESGVLPAGVTFATTTGVLSGTPTQTGTFQITFTATNGVNPNATQLFTLNIGVGSPPFITSPNNTVFITGQANSFTVTATGTPAPKITETGKLPAGVTFNSATGTLSGDPTVGGTFSITFTAANGVGANVVQNFTLTVYQAPAFTSAGSLEITQGNSFNFTAAATGYPAPSIVEKGALPTGVTWNTSTKMLTGRPMQSGTYAITLTATNSIFPDATQIFLLTVDPTSGPVNPTLTSTLQTEAGWLTSAMYAMGQGLRSIQPLVPQFSSALTNEYNSVVAQQKAFMVAVASGLAALGPGDINGTATLFTNLKAQAHQELPAELKLLQDAAGAFPNVDQTAIIAAENAINNVLGSG